MCSLFIVLYTQGNLLAEGSEREAGHLEMLASEGDTNDGDAKQNAEENVHQACPQSATNNPNDVQGNADAANGTFTIFHLGSEGPQTEQAEFEGLQGHWPSDDGNRHGQRTSKVTNGSFESATDPPNNISEYFHIQNVIIVLLICLFMLYYNAVMV